MILICLDCGSPLTDEERHYFEGRCEACEREWSNGIRAWLAGEPNEELDKAFSARKNVH